MASMVFPSEQHDIDGEQVDSEGRKFKYKSLPLYHPNSGEGRKKVKAKVQV